MRFALQWENHSLLEKNDFLFVYRNHSNGEVLTHDSKTSNYGCAGSFKDLDM